MGLIEKMTRAAVSLVHRRKRLGLGKGMKARPLTGVLLIPD